jgi:hypothetical protein
VSKLENLPARGKKLKNRRLRLRRYPFRVVPNSGNQPVPKREILHLAAGDITRARHGIRNQVGVATVESDDREIRLYSERGHVATALLRAAGCLVAGA